MLIKKEKG